MDPMERVKLERRIDELLTSKDSSVRSMGLQARQEMKSRRWDRVEPVVREAERLASSSKTRPVLELLVERGCARSISAARRLVEDGRVSVNGVTLRKPFSTASSEDAVTILP